MKRIFAVIHAGEIHPRKRRRRQETLPGGKVFSSRPSMEERKVKGQVPGPMTRQDAWGGKQNLPLPSELSTAGRLRASLPPSVLQKHHPGAHHPPSQLLVLNLTHQQH